MALKTRKEFAEITGISISNFSNYVTRRKIIVEDDGRIDDENNINVEFLERQKVVKEKKETGTSDKRYNSFVNNKSVKKNRIKDMAEMDREKLQADTDKKRYDADIAKIKLEKLQGLLIPTELVVSVIQLQAQSLKKSYHEACEKLIIIFSQRKKLSNKQVGEIRKELIGVVNDAIDEGISESKKGIKNIVDEYSETRGVGEKA